MSLDEFKEKANEIKNEIEPKVKETAKKAGKKAKKAKKKVTDFVEEHFSKDKEENSEEDIVEAEFKDVTEREENEEKEPAKDGFSEIFEAQEEDNIEASDEETVNEEAGDSEGSGLDEESAESADAKDYDSETIGSDEDEEKHESEIERIEGVVVGTMKDKYNQFKVNVLPKVKNVASNVGSKAKEAASAVGNKVKEKAVDIAPKAKETAQNVGTKVMDTAMGIGPKAKNAAQDLGSKVKQTAQDFGPKAKDTVVDTAKNVGPKVYEGAKKAGETISFQGYRLRKTIGKKMKNSIKKKFGLAGDGTDDGDHVKYYEVKKKKTNRFISHFRTVTTHKNLVFKHCVKAGIPLQGITHDLSKFSPTEFYYGVKFFRGDKSPNEGEREDHGFSYAWMHHKGRNKHHFEYWNDYNNEANKALPVKMPLKYVIEMFCDRVAASKVYLKDKYTDKSPYEYFDKGRTRRSIHQETSDFLEKLLKMLAEKGESYTFMYIKWYKKHHKDY